MNLFNYSVPECFYTTSPILYYFVILLWIEIKLTILKIKWWQIQMGPCFWFRKQFNLQNHSKILPLMLTLCIHTYTTVLCCWTHRNAMKTTHSHSIHFHFKANKNTISSHKLCVHNILSNLFNAFCYLYFPSTVKKKMNCDNKNGRNEKFWLCCLLIEFLM